MLNKTQIKICLGSSCFSRGNQELVGRIKKYISDNKLESRVALSGDHCLGECQEGPNIRIAGKLINNISLETVETILDENLTDIL